jgi:hypothetical protein
MGRENFKCSSSFSDLALLLLETETLLKRLQWSNVSRFSSVAPAGAVQRSAASTVQHQALNRPSIFAEVGAIPCHGGVEELDMCHPLCHGIGVSVELADVTVRDVTVTNAAVRCTVQQV